MRKRISLLLSIVMILVMVTPALAAVNLDFNGRDYQPVYESYLEDGITTVTLDVIAETLGCDAVVEDQIVKIIENDNVLQMTLGSTSAIVNGAEKTMPKAPEVINNQIYVPLRFVYESFGAVVDWEGQTKTVAITYNETRDGMTADELMAKSTAVMNEVGTYKMAADVQANIDATVKETGKDPESMKMNMDADIEAWIQMDPIVMYMIQKASIDMPEAPTQLPAPQTIETEMLMNEDGIFMTMPGIGWVKMDLEGLDFQELMKQSMAQDPASIMQQMKDMGMTLTFANDQEKEGRKYWVLNSAMGDDIFKSDYFEQVSQQLSAIGQDIDLQKMLEAMELDFYYSVWIDKETLYNDYMDLAGTMKFKMDLPAAEGSPGGSMDMAMDMEVVYSMMDYGVEFSTPDVKDARDFEEVMAEQMAAADVKSVPAPEPLPTEPQEEPQSEEPVSEEDSQSEEVQE